MELRRILHSTSWLAGLAPNPWTRRFDPSLQSEVSLGMKGRKACWQEHCSAHDREARWRARNLTATRTFRTHPPLRAWSAGAPRTRKVPGLQQRSSANAVKKPAGEPRAEWRGLAYGSLRLVRHRRRFLRHRMERPRARSRSRLADRATGLRAEVRRANPTGQEPGFPGRPDRQAR